MSPELKTFLIAMSPIVELRGSIPFALEVYHLPVWSAYLFSILGNLVPLILIIRFLEPISRILSEHSLFFKKIFCWIFERTRKRNTRLFIRLERLAVIILIATPIPFVGGWTGAIAAFIFAIPFREALPLVIIGSLLAGLVVLLLTLGVAALPTTY